jgi:hypothetical protein
VSASVRVAIDTVSIAVVREVQTGAGLKLHLRPVKPYR